jgi:hypothetical protein
MTQASAHDHPGAEPDQMAIALHFSIANRAGLGVFHRHNRLEVPQQ